MNNPRYKNGNARRKLRIRMKAMGLPCAICGRPIHYDEPSDAKHPLSFVIDERVPVSRYREGGFFNPTHAALDPDNVQPAHWICNARKGAKTMQELFENRVRINMGGTQRKGCPTKTTPYAAEEKRVDYLSIINLPDGEW